jgi:hypothetical protein
MRLNEPPWAANPEIIRRPWSAAERRVVVRGFLGRLTIAIEPLLIGVFFGLLPVFLLLRHQEAAVFAAPIFAFAAIAFFVYAIALMVPPTRAVLQTFEPIYTVDGYIRYRREGTVEPQFFVAVLDAGHHVLGEWPLREWPTSIGDRDLWAVIVEFSRYGGIHKIDGHPTGVLPAEISPFGVGIAQDEARRKHAS